MSGEPIAVEELLGRLLNPAAPLDAVRVDGGLPSDLVERLAGSLRGLRGLQLALVQAKYLLMPDAYARAADLTFAAQAVRASRQWRSWAPHRPRDVQRLRAACELAVELQVHPPACQQCQRRGIVLRASLVQPCPACAGTGYRPPRNAQLARELGIGRDRYQRTWRARLDAIRHDVGQAESAALRRISIQFGRRPGTG